MENKQKNAKFWLKPRELSFFSQNFHNTLFCLMPMFINEDMGKFQLYLRFNPFKTVRLLFDYLMTFYKKIYEICKQTFAPSCIGLLNIS